MFIAGVLAGVVFHFLFMIRLNMFVSSTDDGFLKKDKVCDPMNVAGIAMFAIGGGMGLSPIRSLNVEVNFVIAGTLWALAIVMGYFMIREKNSEPK